MNKSIYIVRYVDVYAIPVLATSQSKALEYVDKHYENWTEEAWQFAEFSATSATRLRKNDPLPNGWEETSLLWGSHKKDISVAEARKDME